MLQEIKFRYFNESLQTGMVSCREAYLSKPPIIKLNVEVDDVGLVYRATGSNKRISYYRLKKGLRKKSFSIFEEVPKWVNR